VSHDEEIFDEDEAFPEDPEISAVSYTELHADQATAPRATARHILGLPPRRRAPPAGRLIST
jgi:hypothetical protein